MQSLAPCCSPRLPWGGVRTPAAAALPPTGPTASGSLRGWTPTGLLWPGVASRRRSGDIASRTRSPARCPAWGSGRGGSGALFPLRLSPTPAPACPDSGHSAPAKPLLPAVGAKGVLFGQRRVLSAGHPPVLKRAKEPSERAGSRGAATRPFPAARCLAWDPLTSVTALCCVEMVGNAAFPWARPGCEGQGATAARPEAGVGTEADSLPRPETPEPGPAPRGAAHGPALGRTGPRLCPLCGRCCWR